VKHATACDNKHRDRQHCRPLKIVFADVEIVGDRHKARLSSEEVKKRRSPERKHFAPLCPMNASTSSRATKSSKASTRVGTALAVTLTARGRAENTETSPGKTTKASRPYRDVNLFRTYIHHPMYDVTLAHRVISPIRKNHRIISEPKGRSVGNEQSGPPTNGIVSVP